MAKNNIAEYAGWYGMIAILLSFSLISFGVFTATSWIYQTLNLTGAIGIAWNAYIQRAQPSVLLNIVYAVVALFSLIRILI
jgi:hypothetical protein